jgi:hypothetical protein
MISKPSKVANLVRCSQVMAVLSQKLNPDVLMMESSEACDYYALFFSDPDGIRFEVMNHIKRRKTVR